MKWKFNLRKFARPSSRDRESWRGLKFGLCGVAVAMSSTAIGFFLPTEFRPITTALFWIGFLMNFAGFLVHILESLDARGG